MLRALLKVFDGYGSFFGLSHPLSRFLLLTCTMLHPLTGSAGLECAFMVVLWRKILSFPEIGVLEIVNGLLFGMLMGSLYQPGWSATIVMVLASLLIVLSTACLNETVGRVWRLPVLGLPYVLAGYIMLPIVSHLGLTPLLVQPSLLPPVAPTQTLDSPLNLLAPLGSLYFNGTALGGVLVFSAFALSSRYLALLTLASSLVCTFFLHQCYRPDALAPQTSLFAAMPLPLLIAQMNGVLTAGILGALYTVPSPRSVMVSMAAAILACILTLFFEHTFWSTTFPPLALPFVLSIYIAVLALSGARGGPWLRFWLLIPALPEQTLERLTVGRARGLDLHSVALLSPVSGTWEVYQGFDGSYTHSGPWRYALDLIQTADGQSYKGDGTALTGYYSFGKPVLSPGWGTVVAIVNNLADNQPGEVDIVNNWGNYLLIRLDSGPYVMLAHLQRGSIRVDRHYRVTPGQLLALCGNSGRSPQPHLHIHVQMSPELGASTVPFHLCHVLIRGDDGSISYKLHGCPKEKQQIATTTRNAALARALHLTVGRCFDFRVEGGKCLPGALTSEASTSIGRMRASQSGASQSGASQSGASQSGASQSGASQTKDVRTTGSESIERLAVKIDLNGQFYLEVQNSWSDKTSSANERRPHAQVAFAVTDDLVAFYDRNHVPDPLLDAYILAVGLTPLAEGRISWQDKIPVRLLPIKPPIKWLWSIFHPFSPCLDSFYNRLWHEKEMIWIQTGIHRIAWFGNFFRRHWYTEARLSEQSGVLSLELKDENDNILLRACLDGYGVREDNGIPETILSCN